MTTPSSVWLSTNPLNVITLGPVHDPKQAVIVARPATYDDAVKLVKKHFRTMTGDKIIFQTNELAICGGLMLDITEDAWPGVKDRVQKLLFRLQ
ncbi:hypothetical protein V5O48_007012 [Marasmius crinis-equi]|uniref:Uncharacterized protein n=1 Tax=Marasmius crinis-equi TaxID=585013 RepID=A0ABR3FIC9_9AGAR